MIRAACKRAELLHAEADEVVQETVICVFEKMADFVYDPAQGSFRAWLFNLIGWRIEDQRRKRLPDSPMRKENARATDKDSTAAFDGIPGRTEETVAEELARQWKLSTLERAVEKIKGKVKARHFQIFQLYALQGFAGTRVAKSLGVTVGQVYLVTHRITRLVEKEVALMERMGLT